MSSLYVNRFENCAPILHDKFIIREIQGVKDGSPKISIAFEELAEGGKSPIHYHKEASECQFVLEGEGQLKVGNKKVKITPGDLVKIPAGESHCTSNKGSVPLKLLCLLAKAWTFEDTVFEEKVSENTGEIYIRREEGCSEIHDNPGERIYELVGRKNGEFDKFSIAIVKIDVDHFSERHYHKKAEESYLILKGEGRIVVDEEEWTLTPGDFVRIEAKKVHQIFSKTPLEFLCICTPAWTPEDMIRV